MNRFNSDRGERCRAGDSAQKIEHLKFYLIFLLG